MTSGDPATGAPHAELPALTSAPTFTKRELRLGAAGVGLGLLVGVLGTLGIGLLASNISTLAATTPMTDAATTCRVTGNASITVGDKGQSISMKSAGAKSAGAKMTDLACVFTQLEAPDSMISRIDSTRALDGRQTATWKDYSASWGYHPDNGLDIVIEVVAK
ncbi:hypothetical protein [Cryobacterium sp. MDB2-33-2]|uniref:hypothetical protein n=1 Tax=Cryobacterium sp. MDB2-33-2 TaxID=1259179 RepID=UPI001068D896|nr:hypothetical protein [Cryobacterium sp. MDB2-33-2]TFC02328.1 hypothetical protein E3O59_18840 [Cryobacterium sp. MDB2-33-2]